MLHWVFDLDNTLVDSFPAFKRDIREVFSQEGIAYREEDLDLAYRLHFMDFIQHLVPPEKVAAVERGLIEAGTSRPSTIQPYEGVFEMLSGLRTRACDVSIWTAREMESASVILRQTGLEKYFDRVVTRSCRPTTKPHPEGLEFLITQSRHGKDLTLMVGDHAMDIEGAQNAGVKSVHAGWGIKTAPPKGADYAFDSIAEFARWTRSI